MLLYRVILACVFLVPARAVSDNDSGLQSPALKPLIQRANVYLSVGQFADAAKTYTEALEHAPSDYLLYYKRATAYFSMNRHSNALEDFNTVLHLTNGNFDKAVLMKAKILAKEANWSEAKALVKKYSKKAGTGDKDGQDLLFAIADGEATTKKAEAAQRAKKYDECIEHSTNALAIASHAVWLRELRLNCALAMGDVEQAIGDMTRLTHLLQPSTELFQKIANMSYFLLPVNSQPLQTLKQCLHFDPDSKPCRTSLRTLKAFEKDIQKLGALEDSNNWSGLIRLIVGSTSEPTGLAQRFDANLDASTAMLKLPASLTPRKRSPRRLLLYSLACKAYIRLSQITKAETWCNEVVNMDENNVDGLVGKAEAQMKQEEWEDAIQLLEKAFNASGRSREIAEKLEKARRLLKQARMKDYYKVLGVSRDADAQTIKKAYRKTSLKAHPDKGGSEAKMATVNEAYEVLSDPELRARYDRGDDPNDPESGRGQGGHPFHFGGGGPFQHMFFQQGGPFGGQQFHWSSG